MKKQVNVQTTNADLSRASDDKRVNWNDSSDRKWLMNHLHWAMNNGKRVVLYPESN